MAATGDELPVVATAGEEPAELESMTITGSRIARTDVEGALPVTIIDREQIDRSGETSVADFVRGLSINTHGSYRSQNDGYGHGSSQINLRGLGSERSLVLVDGRRLPKSPISTSYQDLNTIPMGAVERIEILSDGASAIYGSDAIGGVVNIITRSDYEGWELEYGRAETDSGGGGRDFGTVLFGDSGADWRIFASYSFNGRDVTLNRDFQWFESEFDPRSNNFTTVDPWTGEPYFDFTAIPDGCGTSAAFELQPFPDSLNGVACAYDTNFEASDETSVDTEGLQVKFQHDLGEVWSAWLNASYSRTDSFGQRPPPATSSLFAFPLPADSPNNPTNPASALYDPAFGANVPVHYWHRFDALGNNSTTVETDFRDLQLGLTGTVRAVDLDFGVRSSRSTTDDLTTGILAWPQAHFAILDGRYDLQDPHGSPPEVLDALGRSHRWWFDYDQDEIFATAGFDAFELAGQPLQWVVGGEWRDESSYSDSTHQGFGGPLSASRDVLALYFESLLQFGYSVELSLAGRYDDYSDWGDAFSPKLSLRWRALDSLVLRASYGEGFRAPELALAARGEFSGFGWTNRDPQSCELQGQPPGCVVQFQGFDIVSPGLGAENSKQYSVGFVWQVLDPLSLMVDYYNIRIDDQIQFLLPDWILVRDQLGLPIPEGMGVTRDPATGQLQAIVHGIGNLGNIDTSGVDLDVSLDLEVGPGWWHSQLQGSYVIEDDWNGIDFSGLSGVPDARATWLNSYEVGAFTLTWNSHYIGSQEGDIPDYSQGRVPTWVSHDLQLAWEAPWQATIALGAQNAFNKQPALDVGATRWSRYNINLYDAFGRTVYVSYRQTF